jgi:hypothetical protein
MRACRSYSLAAFLLPFVLVACSSKEAAQPPPEESKKVEPSQPQPATPATTDAPKADAEPSPTSRAGAQKATPAQPASPSAVPAPPPAAPNKELPAVPQPAAPNPAVPVTEAPTKPPSAPPPAKAAPENVIMLKASIGGVRFEHETHSKTRKIPCETCHHASRPGKPATSPQQGCRQCHTSVATLPMKTKLQSAFHNPTATTGTCIDCHKASNAKGRSAPVKCLDCHKKENK